MNSSILSMRAQRSNLLIFLSLLFLAASAHAGAPALQVCHSQDCVAVELVTRQADLEKGLMYRDNLGAGQGMIFDFAADGIYSFWMKNMKFDLDLLWIGKDGHIVYIAQNVPACKSDPCPVYTPKDNARYVLEINSGYAASHHWAVGDLLNLKGF